MGNTSVFATRFPEVVVCFSQELRCFVVGSLVWVEHAGEILRAGSPHINICKRLRIQPCNLKLGNQPLEYCQPRNPHAIGHSGRRLKHHLGAQSKPLSRGLSPMPTAQEMEFSGWTESCTTFKPWLKPFLLVFS